LYEYDSLVRFYERGVGGFDLDMWILDRWIPHAFPLFFALQFALLGTRCRGVEKGEG